MTFLDQKFAPSQQATLHYLNSEVRCHWGGLGQLAGLSSGAVTRFGRELIDLGLYEEKSADRLPVS